MHSVRYGSWNVPAVEVFFFWSFFILIFLLLGLYWAEFFFDSVEVGLLCTWSWRFSLAAARDRVPLRSVGAVVVTPVYWALRALSNTCFCAGWSFVALFLRSYESYWAKYYTRLLSVWVYYIENLKFFSSFCIYISSLKSAYFSTGLTAKNFNSISLQINSEYSAFLHPLSSGLKCLQCFKCVSSPSQLNTRATSCIE